MTPHILIRPVQERDIPEIVSLVGAAFHEYGMAFDPEGWDKDLTQPLVYYPDPQAILVVAENQGTVVGMIGGSLEEGRAVLKRLYLRGSARGQGLGERLCRHVEQWAQEHGRPQVELWSDVRFLHAHRLYRRLGYQIFDSRIIDDPDRSVEFGMRRSLKELSVPAGDPLIPELRQGIRAVRVDRVKENSDLWQKTRWVCRSLVDVRRLAHKVGLPAQDPLLDAAREVLIVNHAVVGIITNDGKILLHVSSQA